MLTKKYGCVLLAAVLALTVLCGCNKKESVGMMADGADGYVPQKELELTVWNTQGTDYIAKEISDNVVENWLVIKTKVKVTNVYGNDGGQWSPKLTKLVASNNLPNIVWCQSGQGPAHFAELDDLELVWELTPEMIQKYAPNLWAKTPEYLWERIKVNGKILGIPFNLRPGKETLPGMSDEILNTINKIKTVPINDAMALKTGYLYIRDDILKQFYPEAKDYDELIALLSERGEPIGDELLDIPIFSTDEYIQFMYDIVSGNFKSADGKKVYAYGYTGGDNWEALAWLGADMYGYKGHNYTGTWNSETKRIEIPLVGDLIRRAAKTQNQMLNDNVIDPESLAQTINQFEAKVLNGQYAICSFNMLGDTVSLNEQIKSAGHNFQYRPFLTQVPAQEGYDAYEEEFLWNESLCLLKTLSEEDVYQVLNWINTQYSDEYEEIINWGPEEAGLYTETEDGKREFTDPRFTDYFINQNASALTAEETKGLSGPLTEGYRIGGLFGVTSTAGVNQWMPVIMSGKEVYTPSCNSGFKFLPDSPHVTNVKTYPACQAWSTVYADIPEVVTFWSERATWEDKFKMALAAKPQEFDEKWQGAIDDLNQLVPVSEMADKMTAIAQPIAEQIATESN